MRLVRRLAGRCEVIPHGRTEATRDDWQTPEWLQSLIGAFAAERDLVSIDPCASDNVADWFCDWNRTRDEPIARLRDIPYCNESDPPTLVYCNPPYGAALRHWAPAIDRWFRMYPITIALVPARPGSVWWSLLAAPDRFVIVPHERLTFVGADTGAAFPSALIVGGLSRPLVEAFTRAFLGDAWIVKQDRAWHSERCARCGHSLAMHDRSLCACLGRSGFCGCKEFQAPDPIDASQTEAPFMWCDPMLPKPKRKKVSECESTSTAKS